MAKPRDPKESRQPCTQSHTRLRASAGVEPGSAGPTLRYEYIHPFLKHTVSTHLGPGMHTGPRGNTSNERSKSGKGRCETLSPVLGALTKQGKLFPWQPSHALACNWYFMFIVLHQFSPSVTPCSCKNSVCGFSEGRATSKNTWSKELCGDAITPVRKAEPPGGWEQLGGGGQSWSFLWAQLLKHPDQKWNWGAERRKGAEGKGAGGGQKETGIYWVLLTTFYR